MRVDAKVILFTNGNSKKLTPVLIAFPCFVMLVQVKVTEQRAPIIIMFIKRRVACYSESTQTSDIAGI
jgi:hypothetical protein